MKRILKCRSTVLLTRLKGHALAQALVALALTFASGPSQFLFAAPVALLPLESSDRDTGAFDELLRDPVVVAAAIHELSEADQLQADINQKEAELRTARGSRILELNALIFESYAVLSYYYADPSRPETKAKLSPARSSLNQYARLLARTVKNAIPKARYSYHVAVLQLQTGAGKSAAAQTIAQIEKTLPRNLLGGAQLITALNNLQRGGRDYQNALATLKQAAARANPRTSIMISLLLAKSAPQKDYRNQLAAASQRASRISAEEKTVFMSQAVAIWQKKEGRAIDWNRPPFNLQRFTETAQARAILERGALADLAKRQDERAIQRYRGLAKSYEGTLTYRALETRVLDLQQDFGQRNKSMRGYESELLTLQNRLKEAGLLGSGNEAACTEFAKTVSTRHRLLADRSFTQATANRASIQDRQAGVHILSNFVGTLGDEVTKESYTEKIGILYALSNEHAKAVGVYLDLALNGKDASRRPRYYSAAIVSQKVLAKWPTEAPWLTSVAAGSKGSRAALSDMFAKLRESTPQRWDLAAHQGLLQISLGQPQLAFDLWTAQLIKDPSGMHASQSAGYMMVSYEKTGRWEVLESLARVTAKANLKVLFRSQNINSQNMLALALLEGGKKLVADAQFAPAVKKLDEFVAQYRSHQRRDEAMLFLAEGLKGVGNHNRSIEMLTALVEQYPKSKFQRIGLLRGSEASISVALEDTAIFFEETFVVRFPKDSETENVRDQLISLLLGREHFARAENQLKIRFSSRHLSKSVTSQAAIDWLEIEERHGSPAKATQVADLVLSSNTTDTAARAAAIQVKAKSLYARRDVNGLSSLLRTSLTLDQTQTEALDAQGQIRFNLAELRASSLKFDLDPLSVSDPTAVLNQQYRLYWDSKTAYESVCSNGQSSYCAPAMYRLARISEDTVEWLQDLKIVSTLDAQVVNAFRARKQSIMEGLTTLAEASDNRALAITAEGHNTPDWTEEILWQNSADWNFDRVSGNSGKGAIQWKAQFTSLKRD